jgi:hypothetical protein
LRCIAWSAWAEIAADQLLDAVSAEIGETVGGLLVAPFLREFYVSLDHLNRTTQLSSCTTRGHIIDWNLRVGIAVGATSDGQHIAVSAVHANTPRHGRHRLDALLLLPLAARGVGQRSGALFIASSRRSEMR